LKRSWKNIPEGGIITEAGNSTEFKTGWWKTSAPNWDSKKCIQCLKCHFMCPEGAIKVKEGKIVGIDLDFCKGCGICASECPVKAITMGGFC
jgi:pyruvate ferredoxin oxidoreductase delta subunit